MPKRAFTPILPDLDDTHFKTAVLRPPTDSVSTFCTWATLVSALRHQLGFSRGLPMMLGLVVPEGHVDPEQYRDCCERICRRVVENVPWMDHDAEFVACVLETTGSRKHRNPNAWDLATNRWFFGIATSKDAFPQDFVTLADAFVEVRPVSARDIRAAARMVVGLELSNEDAELALKLPLEKLDAVFRVGRSLRRVRDILRKLTDEQPKAPPPPQDSSKQRLTLETLPGMGEATEWGQCLATELAAWRRGELEWKDIDRGVVLSGPSGTGKTTYARALANSCNVSLIATSYAKWQACGHLGDTLKAMRASFADAVRVAPSILFIDEIDSIGDRTKFGGDNAHYSFSVVSGLLEALDGIEKRQGVIVVGACNYPELLDEALMRPGRLDRHIRIPLPDNAARLAILRFHGINLPDEQLIRIIDRTEGKTGAFLEQLVRGARRRARVAKRALSVDDLDAGLPQQISLPEDDIFRVAVHETGHAAVTTILSAGEVLHVSIATKAEVSDGTVKVFRGGASVRSRRVMLRTREDIIDEIAVCLAGIAAEETFFGAATDGAGGVVGSDLDRATSLAMNLAASSGLGSSLVFLGQNGSVDRLLSSNATLRNEVHSILQEGKGRARTVITAHRAVIMSLAHQLAEATYLEGDVFREAFGN